MIWWVFFRLRIWCFFPFSIFLVLFRGWHDILKEIDESTSQLGIAVTYLLTEERSYFFFYSIDQFLENLFFIHGGRDNFVISFPSSTAHFNCIPHEFSVVLASCLCIKLHVVPAHVFFVNTIGVTHFNTLVRFVLVSLRPLLSHQSTNYLTRKTVNISRQEEKIFLNVIWKKAYLSFQRKCASHVCHSVQCDIFSYFY